MTDTELDLMFEAALADEWEEQTKTPDFSETIKKLQTAMNLLTEAVDVLTEAQEEVGWSPEQFRIGSLASEVRFLADDVKKQIERM